jgi:hypothetical protein
MGPQMAAPHSRARFDDLLANGCVEHDNAVVAVVEARGISQATGEKLGPTRQGVRQIVAPASGYNGWSPGLI